MHGKWVGVKNAPHWLDDKGKKSVIKTTLDSVDNVVREYEQKWGVRSLERLVSPKLAARFEQARLNLNQAVQNENVNEIVAKCEDVIRGYKVMEKEAVARGYKQDISKVWYMVNDKGEKYAFINDYSDAMYLDDEYKIYNMPEVIRMIEDYDKQFNYTLSEVKKHFKKAEIVKVKKIDEELPDDEIPF